MLRTYFYTVYAQDWTQCFWFLAHRVPWDKAHSATTLWHPCSCFTLYITKDLWANQRTALSDVIWWAWCCEGQGARGCSGEEMHSFRMASLPPSLPRGPCTDVCFNCALLCKYSPENPHGPPQGSMTSSFTLPGPPGPLPLICPSCPG